ncbi:hypothetical protein EVAR_22899_1 [Eumeta japonica]|uniref:Uncharacterized protein n=1 Tax=Eumeta variegata TaxID=151549 RepID=A0A4C1UUM7_EUMVA|nr:hypothetical protein EVAR_22899_1 [Eumeta japonica]
MHLTVKLHGQTGERRPMQRGGGAGRGARTRSGSMPTRIFNMCRCFPRSTESASPAGASAAFGRARPLPARFQRATLRDSPEAAGPGPATFVGCGVNDLGESFRGDDRYSRLFVMPLVRDVGAEIK